MKLGFVVLRTVLGALFIGHGTQKLFGWFEGQGLRDTGDSFESIGLRPGRPQATTAGVSETVGGMLIASGFLTPLGCALITGVMTQAIKSVHAGRGPWFSQGGWEYNAVLIAAVFAIAEQGPGGLAAGPRPADRALRTAVGDRRRGRRRRGARADHTRALLDRSRRRPPRMTPNNRLL